MAVPEDSDDVLGMVRLGWSVAEVRGRNRPDAPPGAQLKLPPRTGHALPLDMERTETELRIEAQAVLGALASKLAIDADGANSSSFSAELDNEAKILAQATIGPGAAKAPPPAPSVTDGAAPGPPGVPTASGMTSTVAAGLVAAATATGTAASDWDSLEELIYKFDAHIQDTLATRPATQACGYQLGRALAECYWALDPSLPDTAETWTSWSFLLGEARTGEIGRLLGRLSAYFHPYTPSAIAGSVQVWRNVAKSPEWRQEAYPNLYDQIRHWYELVVVKQDPTTLIQPYTLLKNYRLVWRTLRAFWVQLVLAALAAVALGAFAYLLTKPSFSAGVKSLLATIGIVGFSVAGLAAKVKNEAQAMLTRLKQDAYTDLITQAITTAPLPPSSVSAPKSGPIPALTKKAKMAAIMRERRFTPITPT
jgi:hypothetical protein